MFKKKQSRIFKAQLVLQFIVSFLLSLTVGFGLFLYGIGVGASEVLSFSYQYMSGYETGGVLGAMLGLSLGAYIGLLGIRNVLKLNLDALYLAVLTLVIFTLSAFSYRYFMTELHLIILLLSPSVLLTLGVNYSPFNKVNE